ncbi:hypothetical protein D9M68_905280 [compost metagenome]
MPAGIAQQFSRTAIQHRAQRDIYDGRPFGLRVTVTEQIIGRLLVMQDTKKKYTGQNNTTSE